MGATNVWYAAEGASYEEEFEKLRREAEREYGWDEYNGTISTMFLSRRPVVKISDKFGATSEKKAFKHMEDDGWGMGKRECHVLDLGIIGWEVAAYEKVPRTSAVAAEVSYQTFFVGYADNREICCEKTAAAAKSKVKAYMESHQSDPVSRYHVEKEARKMRNGRLDPDACACSFAMERKVRITKSKPKSASAKPIHRWMFYGWAAC